MFRVVNDNIPLRANTFFAIKSRMDADEVREILRSKIRASGQTKQAWARAHNVAQSVVSDVLNRKVGPGPSVLKALGLKVAARITTYERAR